MESLLHAETVLRMSHALAHLALLLPPLHRSRNRGSERFSNLPKVIHSRAVILEVWIPSCSTILSPHLQNKIFPNMAHRDQKFLWKMPVSQSQAHWASTGGAGARNPYCYHTPLLVILLNSRINNCFSRNGSSLTTRSSVETLDLTSLLILTPICSYITVIMSPLFSMFPPRTYHPPT